MKQFWISFARTRIASFFGCVTLLWGVSALGESYHSSDYHFVLEAKFGAYLPSIDKSHMAVLNQVTPFSDYFGDQTSPKGANPSYGLLSSLEFNYQFFHHHTGSLAVGFSAGYYQKEGKQLLNVSGKGPCTIEANPDGGSRIFKSSGNEVDSSTCFSEDTSTLHVVPLSLLLVYRFEYLQYKWHIPIIPYIKAGFGYFFWWFSNPDQFVSTVKTGGKDTAASGGSFGLVFHPGIAIDLGGIDTEAGITIRREAGIHRVMLSIEMNGAWITNFSATKALNLSDISFYAGLGFEF